MGWRLIMGVFKRLTEGDLTAEVKVELGGHFGLVLRILQEVNRNLGQIVAQVRASSEAGRARRSRSPTATRTSRSAPSSRPRRSRRLPGAWRSCPRR